MENSEIRRMAWERLFRGQWFWKLFGGGLLLGLCGQAVQTALGGVLGRLGVMDWQQYADVLKANRADLVTPVPELTRHFVWTASTATGLELFVGWIMAGIMAYGSGVILARCLDNEAEGWLGAAFGGFRMPLGLFALMFRYALICLGWTILSIPTLGLLMVIPLYRYRFLWLVKAEHPDWSAGECLRATRRLMEGHKMRSFKLDCSYWKPITAVLALVLLMMGGLLLLATAGQQALTAWAIAGGGLFVISLLALFPVAVVVGQYLSVGQGLLYRELTETQTQHEERKHYT